MNSDGNITFEEADRSSTERNVARMLTGPPRVSPFLADLDPTTGTGRIFVNAASDQYTVTWCNVRGFDSARTVTAQATLLPSGVIEMNLWRGDARRRHCRPLAGPHRRSLRTVNLSDSGPTDGGSAAVGERFAQEPQIDLVALTRKFYSSHGDNYDQLVLWTDRSLITDAFAYETTVKNEITGLGIDTYDLAGDFGSAGRLRSLVVMDWVGKYPDDPAQKFLGENNTVSLLGQESGHRWLAFLEFRDRGNDIQRSDALLGRDLAHWSFFFDSDGSVMEGNDIQDLGGGSFRTVGAVQRYSLLDQYAMGLVPSRVPPFFYVENPTNMSASRTAGSTPEVGVTFNGTRRDILIQDILDVHGPRVPRLRPIRQGPPPGVHLPWYRPAGRRTPMQSRRSTAFGEPGRGFSCRPPTAACERSPRFAKTATRFPVPSTPYNPRMKHLLVAIGLALTAAPFAAQSPPTPRSGESLDLKKLDALEPLVQQAIAEKKLPGAVVLIGRGDRIVYQKAIGRRAVVPAPEAMTLDTIFDLASLTKVVATTTSVMKLVEDGKIRLNDRVSAYIPGFERYGKADITIRHLMTHVSGLRPDVDLGDMWNGSDTAIALAIEEVPTAPPGERFVYSDINYFLLGDIVRRVSGLPLDRFAHDRIFEPLGMKDTMFLPAAALVTRIAPTESCTPLGWPCEGPGHADAARRRARSDRAAHGRRCRARGPVQHRRRSRDLLPHAARRRRLQRRPDPLAARPSPR